MDQKLSQLKARHLIVALLGLCLVVFGQTLSFGFTALDDSKHIWGNPYVTTLSLKNMSFFWEQAYYGLYIPVVYNIWSVLAQIAESFFPAHTVTKISPMPFHAFNVAIHILNTFLLFQIVSFLISIQKGLGDQLKLWGPALVTLPFAIHPLQVESVSWVSGMKDGFDGNVCVSISYFLPKAYSRRREKKQTIQKEKEARRQQL